MLGSYGLWDPIEIRDADVAQELIESEQKDAEAQRGAPKQTDQSKKGSLWDVTVGGKYNARPPLYVWLVALGFKVFGVNELAGRLPLALMGILALLLAFHIGRRLYDERAGLACAFVLATAPVFLFQCRQLSSEVVFYTSLLAAAGGMAAYIWPASGKRCPFDLIIGGVGLVAGFLSRGLLLGSLFPLVAVGIAVALSWRTPDRELEAEAEGEPEPDGLNTEPTENTEEEKGEDDSEADAEADADADAEADAEAETDTGEKEVE